VRSGWIEDDLVAEWLRVSWFMENPAWDVEAAKTVGVIPSFLQPLDKPFPMVAIADVGRVAELLFDEWLGVRIVELEGPQRVTPRQIARTLSTLLGREVRMNVVPRSTWETLSCEQGMRHPISRIQMLDGFNEGWIEFAQGQAGSRKGVISLEVAFRRLIERMA